MSHRNAAKMNTLKSAPLNVLRKPVTLFGRKYRVILEMAAVKMNVDAKMVF